MKIFKFSFIFLLVCLCVGCKKAKEKATFPEEEQVEYLPLNKPIVEDIRSHELSVANITSKINVQLQANDKEAQLGGTLRLSQGKGIQISLTAFGLLEIGRLEITPENLLIIDRTHRRYIKKGFEEISYFKENQIDYSVFESLFWNKLFILGHNQETPTDTHYLIGSQGACFFLREKDSSPLAATFQAESANMNITRTQIQAASPNAKTFVTWDYSQFKDYEVGRFPSTMTSSFHLASKPFQITFQLKEVRPLDSWEPTQLSKKYEEVPLETLLYTIIALTK